MKRLFAGLVVVYISLPFLHAQTTSLEEEIVRNAYAKVSFLCAVGVLTENIAFDQSGHEFSQREIDRKMAAAVPTYDLSNFEVGDLATIKDRMLGDFVSLPADGQRILRIRGTAITYKDSPQRTDDPVFHWDQLAVYWANPDPGRLLHPRALMSDFRIGAIQEFNAPSSPPEPMQTVTYRRYATFTVNANLHSESTGPHKAIFIFGTYGHGKEAIIVLDPIIQLAILGVSLRCHVAEHLSRARDTPILIGHCQPAGCALRRGPGQMYGVVVGIKIPVEPIGS